MLFLPFPQLKRTSPSLPRRKASLMHPDNAPRTTEQLPARFSDFRYVGPALENISVLGMRRVTLVARLLRQSQSEQGALVSEEMTASVCDLRIGQHPDRAEIADALRTYYETHISLDQQEDATVLDPFLKDRLYSRTSA